MFDLLRQIAGIALPILVVTSMVGLLPAVADPPPGRGHDDRPRAPTAASAYSVDLPSRSRGRQRP